MVCPIWYSPYHERNKQHHGWVFPPWNCRLQITQKHWIRQPGFHTLHHTLKTQMVQHLNAAGSLICWDCMDDGKAKKKEEEFTSWAVSLAEPPVLRERPHTRLIDWQHAAKQSKGLRDLMYGLTYIICLLFRFPEWFLDDCPWLNFERCEEIVLSYLLLKICTSAVSWKIDLRIWFDLIWVSIKKLKHFSREKERCWFCHPNSDIRLNE